jgi:bifunctional non-homologous end joining protein LigD
LELTGRDLRKLPLEKRKHSLQKLLNKTADNRLRYSKSFDDGENLLAHAEALGLEGIVSKGRARPYRSVRCDWIKVKCSAWREQESWQSVPETPLIDPSPLKLALAPLK